MLEIVLWTLMLIAVPDFGVVTSTEDESCVCGQRSTFSFRIAGGKVAKEGSHPWQAAIFSPRKDFACGGSVITDWHILSSGYCIRGLWWVKGWKVRLGTVDRLSNKGELFDVTEWFVHPKYHALTDTPISDIVIGKLNRKITFGELIQPICLNNNGRIDLTNRRAIAIGWGMEESEGPLVRRLREASVPVSSDWRCSKSTIGSVYRPELMLCTSSYPKGPCPGDEGGSLMLEVDETYMMLIGIISYVEDCAESTGVVTYTKVSVFHKWIESVTADAKKCQPPQFA